MRRCSSRSSFSVMAVSLRYSTSHAARSAFFSSPSTSGEALVAAAALSSTERRLSARRRCPEAIIDRAATPRALAWAPPSLTGCVVGEALWSSNEAAVIQRRSPSEALSSPCTRR